MVSRRRVDQPFVQPKARRNRVDSAYSSTTLPPAEAVDWSTRQGGLENMGRFLGLTAVALLLPVFAYAGTINYVGSSTVGKFVADASASMDATFASLRDSIAAAATTMANAYA